MEVNHDQSINEKGLLLWLLHGLVCPINSKGSFIGTSPLTGYHCLCYVPVVEHLLEQLTQCVHWVGSIQLPTTPWANALPPNYILLPLQTIILHWILIYLCYKLDVGIRSRKRPKYKVPASNNEGFTISLNVVMHIDLPHFTSFDGENSADNMPMKNTLKIRLREHDQYKPTLGWVISYIRDNAQQWRVHIM